LAKSTRVSSQLAASFAAKGLDIEEFVLDFDYWKSLPGVDRETNIFGRDGANRGSDFFRHVHIVPFNDLAALRQWNRNASKGRANKSNRYLFYVDGGPAYGYLLLIVIDDSAVPNGSGGHQIWDSENADLMVELNRLADDFFYNGKVP